MTEITPDPATTRATIEKFLGTIYEGLEGNVSIVTRSDNGELNSERWFAVPRELKSAIRYSGLIADEDVYLSTAAYPEESRKAYVDGQARAIYADADSCAPENFRLPPSIVVQTSEGRWHCWWLLDEIVSAHTASVTSHRIAKAHADQGCDSGWATGKILRVPGTLNTKREQVEVVSVEYEDIIYTLDTINDTYSDVELSPVAQRGDTLPEIGQDELPDLEDRLDRAGLAKFYTTLPGESADWSGWMFKFETELFRQGFTADEAFLIVRNSQCNKYDPKYAGMTTKSGGTRAERENPDELLWSEVLAAQAEVQMEEDAIARGAVPQNAGSPEVTVSEIGGFLSIEETRWVKDNPSFIDTYTDWVANSGTDAAEVFQRSLAFMVLSCIYGDLGYLAYHSDTRLNLWMLILGVSTEDRKTTAMNRALTVLHTYEERVQTKIDLANDASTEALNKALGERDGQVSLLNTDEIQGWFEEAKTKNYRSGSLAALSKFYDGKAEVQLRATKDHGNTKRVLTVFNFFGVGIQKHVATQLNRSDFESGFLPRFLWAIADPRPVDPYADVLSNDLLDRARTFGKYPEVEKMVDTFVKRRRTLGKTLRRVEFDDEAMERWNQWTVAVSLWLRDNDSMRHMHAAVGRFKVSVMKAAALLALHDGSDVVRITHVLAALAQAELWFRDMLRMSGEVSSSDFERRVDEIEQYISMGKDRQRAITSVRDKFKMYRNAEMDDYINQLIQRGRVRKTGDGRSMLEALTV